MCTSDSIGVISLAKPTRKGFLQKYKKRFIGSNWRKVWVVLHEDSSLEWYYDEVENDLEGGITLKESPEMIAAGPYANYVPNKPELPKGADPNSLMAFGNKTKDRVHWFMAANLDDLNQWMTAISNTLPPPPQVPPAATTKNSDGEDLRLPPYNPSPTAPPLPQQSNGFAQQRRPPYPYRDGYGRGGYGGGGYGGGNYGGGGYGSPTGGGQNTVIIDRGGNNNMGNFATGMFMGAALTGWGCGLGWGIGPFMGGFGGWGFGYGFGGPRLGYNDTDINITNNYNTTNNTTNNPSEETNGNSNPPEADPAPENGAPEAEVDPEEAEVDPEEAQVDPDSGVDPGLDEGVDPNGFEPGFEPDAEYFNDSGIDPGLMDGGDFGRMEMGGGGEYGMEDMGGSFDMGGFDLGGFDMGGFDMGGFDVGGMDF